MSSVPYTIRLDDALKSALEHEAALDQRPPAQLAVRAIRAMVEGRQAKRAAIEAALAETDEGWFISQEAMADWMDSWDTDTETPPPAPDITPAPR
ncbi:putative transcriptional regulator [Roseovarius sp. MBR-78]|jgi:predicted transcriptional regulator|uniref:CopG family ribbon-helix-helix protein n=1 Tax=Roseovarius sp. MBR-78 TaxID=3156460 RepID=UPI003392A07F